MKKKRITAFLLLILLLVPVIIPFVPVEAQDPDTAPIGYRITGDVVEIWNPDTTYYFNKSSGVQWSEDPAQYWTRNVFAIGYYSGDKWHKIYSADELGTFSRGIDTDYETYVNATLWKDFNYAGYDLRLGVRYHLKLNDTELSVIIYAKNIGAVDYPAELGFAWIVTDIDIPNPKGEDTIYINQTDYRLDGFYDLTFRNMSHTYFHPTSDVDPADIGYWVTEYDPHYRMFDYTQFITLEWDEDVPYTVRFRANGVQEEASVTWMVNGGIFKAGQEKFTTLYWADAEGDYTGEHWYASGAGWVGGVATYGSYIYVCDPQYDRVLKYTKAGSYVTYFSISQTKAPYGVGVYGSYVYVACSYYNRVYKYTTAGSYISSFDISGQSTGVDGLTTDGSYIWIIDGDDDRVYRYTMTGSYSAAFVSLGRNGITTDGSNIWTGAVLKYTMAGSYISTWDPSGQIVNFEGIATDGVYFWICDADDFYVHKYFLNSPPTAPTLTGPAVNARYDIGKTVTFTWTFNDPDAGNTQSAYQLQIVGGIDTGKVTSGVSSTARAIPGTVGSHNWRVKTWDQDGFEGPYSGYRAVIADRIEIYYEELDDSRVNIGTNIEYRVKARLDYDNHALGSGDSITANSGAMAWDAGNGWWDDQRSSGSVGSYVFAVSSASEATYGITALWDNAPSRTGIWDRIIILSLSANTTIPGKGDNVLLYATAELEYDHHTLGAGDSLTLQALAFTWNGTSSRWEEVVTSAIDETRTYDTFTSGNEATYTITAGNMDGKSVAVDWGHPPTITSATITDMDGPAPDNDNLYAMKKYYTFQVVVNDLDGALDISKIYLQGDAAPDFEVRATDLDTTPVVYAIQTGVNEIDLDTGTCTWGEAGDVGTVTFKIRFEWDYTQEADIDLLVYVEDTDGNSAGFTVKQTNYFDVITRLVTEDLAANSTYVLINTGVEISGTVYYATTISGDIASSSYPPDAQFTAVHIYDDSPASVGNNATVLNGVFSVEFTIPNVIQTNTYHVYLDMAGEYTDAAAPDGDTVVVFGISASLLMSFDDETGAIAYDVSGSSNHGTITGATRTGLGKFGKALSFDGADDYITVSNDITLNITTTITMAAWVKTGDAGFQGILSKQGAYGLAVISNYGIRVIVNTTNIDTGPNLFASDTWTFITATYDGSNVKISINGILNVTHALTGVIGINPNDLFIGNVTTSFFNGTLDEVHILPFASSQPTILGLVGTPIATFPYNLQGIIYDMEATDWVFAQEAYEYQGIYVRQNVTYPIDMTQLRFTDGVSWTTMAFNITSGESEITSVVAHLMVHTNTSSGNEWTITWKIYLTEDIFDALNVDLSMYCSDTRFDAWEIVSPAYFNIYNHGGMTEYSNDTSGDGYSVAGEGVFGLAAQNSSSPGGSWAFANVTWRKLQHVNFLVHWWSNTVWDGANLHWDCPSEHNNTGYVEYGIDYWYNGSWLPGWKVRLEIEDGAADANDAWVLVNATWYNRELYVTHEEFYAYYEAYTSTDTSTQFALIVDLWVGIEEGSSSVCGRVGPEYFGINKTTGLWADWRPVKGLEDESVFFAPLLDDNLAVISAGELEMFTVWANLTKTSNQTGLGSPGCDSHQWGLVDYSGPHWRALSPFEVMVGIVAPITTPTVMPGEVPTNFFSALITAMIEGITKPIVAALGGGAKTLYFIMSGLINSAFQYFIPGINFVTSITTTIGTWGDFLADSLIYMTALVVQMFRIITISATTVIDWLTRMISFILTMGGHVLSIIDGTSTAITGLSNMWTLMNFSQWVDFVPVISFVYWVNSIDQRARRMGGGWMSIFIGDIQIITFVLSFLVEWFTRVIEFVINRVMQFINILPI